MELKEIWKKLETEKLEVVRATALAEWPPKSKHPVRKLERAFFYALLYVVFFEGAFVYLLINFQQPLVRLFLVLVILSYVFFFVVNYKVYKKIRSSIDFSGDLFSTLSSIYNNVTASLRFQRKAAIFIYPVAGSAGFLLGFATEKDPSLVIQEPWLLLIMIGTSLALTPVGYYLAKWLEKISYGKYCLQLKNLIDQLEIEKNN